MRQVFGEIRWPVTWVEGAACDDHPIAGIHAFAFSAGRVNPVTLHGRVVGSVFDEGAIRHCLLGGLGPDSLSASRPDQFRQTLANLQNALAQAGFSLGDVVRTWFYLEDLLTGTARSTKPGLRPMRPSNSAPARGRPARGFPPEIRPAPRWSSAPGRCNLSTPPSASRKSPPPCNVPPRPTAARSAAPWRFPPRVDGVF